MPGAQGAQGAQQGVVLAEGEGVRPRRGQVEKAGYHRSTLCPKPIYKTKTEDTKTPETTQRFGTLRHIPKCKVPTTILTRNRVK